MKTRFTVLLFMMFCLMLQADVHAAGEAPGPENPGPAPRFATVMRVSGEVNILNVAGVPSRKLREGDPVLVGQRVRAQSTGEAVLKTGDAGLVGVRPGAEFLAERFSARGAEDDSMVLRLVRGGLRIITGWVGKTNRSAYLVHTPTATMGIRGTDHEPYVITNELAARLAQPEGTYDKVNRGGTTLQGKGGGLDVDAGQVGFAKHLVTQRALITLALPVLLDKVPDFYVPGVFDRELDALSPGVDADAQRALDEFRRDNPASGPPPVVSETGSTPTSTRQPVTSTGTVAAAEMPSTATATVPADAPSIPDTCGAREVARQWIGSLDDAIALRDEAHLLKLFDAKFTVRVMVRSREGGMVRIDLSAKEFAKSTVAALRSLTDFNQRRLSIESQVTANCRRVTVKSVVIEQGQQSGRAYRFESEERYVLEKRGATWIAMEAQTEQR